MPTNSYDLIVVGDDLAGLVAATLCARRGLRVLVLSSPERVWSYTLGPFRLPVEPVAFVGRHTPAVRRVLDELALDHTLKRKLPERPIAYQFVGPDARIDVTADGARLRTELERELRDADAAQAACDAATAISEGLDAILGGDVTFPPTGFRERRAVGRGEAIATDAQAWAETVADQPLIAALLAAPAALVTHTIDEDTGPVGCARAFELWRHGAARLPGDTTALRELLIDKLTHHGGETRAGKLAELTSSWGKVNGVRLASGEELGAGHVVCASPLGDLVEAADRKQQKRLAAIAEGVQVSGHAYTLNLVIDEAGVPEGMAPTVLFVHDPAAPLSGDNAMAILVGQPDDEGRVVVTIRAIAPAPEEPARLPTALSRLRHGLLARLDEVMPFVAEHIVLLHSPHEATAPEGARHDVPKHLPVKPLPTWRSTLDGHLGLSAVPYSVGIKNLTVASSQVLPQLGLEGAFVTGWCAARIVCGGAGKKRDYLKDEVLAGGA